MGPDANTEYALTDRGTAVRGEREHARLYQFTP